jgi:hypothetical protein
MNKKKRKKKLREQGLLFADERVPGTMLPHIATLKLLSERPGGFFFLRSFRFCFFFLFCFFPFFFVALSGA